MEQAGVHGCDDRSIVRNGGDAYQFVCSGPWLRCLLCSLTTFALPRRFRRGKMIGYFYYSLVRRLSTMHSPLAANDSDFEHLGVRSCSPSPPGLPEAWRGLQMRVGVGLILTEHNCIYRSFFDEFAVTSVEHAVRRLMESDGVFLCYNFFIAGAVPAFAFDADWPLLRRGSAPPIRRTSVQGDEPWSWCWDRTLFEVRNEPTSPWSSRTYLRVGGRTSTDAVSNWTACARVLRLFRPRNEAPNP